MNSRRFRAGEVGALCGNALLPAPQTPTFINPPGAPHRRGVGRLSKARNIHNVSARNTRRGRCFYRNGVPLPAFWRFSFFALVRRAVCRFKERQHRGQSEKQGVPAQIPPPIASAGSCAAMSPCPANVSRETPLHCHCFSKEPVPHRNSKNLHKKVRNSDRVAQKSPQHFSFYKTLRIL